MSVRYNSNSIISTRTSGESTRTPHPASDNSIMQAKTKIRSNIRRKHRDMALTSGDNIIFSDKMEIGAEIRFDIRRQHPDLSPVDQQQHHWKPDGGFRIRRRHSDELSDVSQQREVMRHLCNIYAIGEWR